MTKYVALLRGINVGGNKKVEMTKLKKVFETKPLGFSNVRTYINSGNVIFETKTTKTSAESMVKNIEKALFDNFGFEIRTIIRDSESIQKICDETPQSITNDSEQKTDVLFLWNEFDNEKSLDLINTSPVDNVKYIKDAGAIVWSVKRADYTKSGMNKFIGTTIYKHMTARNINTVRKLAELLGN